MVKYLQVFVFISFAFAAYERDMQASSHKNDRTISCKDVNNYLSNIRLFVDQDTMSESKQNRVFDHFINQLDPLKTFLLASDVTYLANLFEFQGSLAEDLSIECGHIREIAKVIAMRMEEASEYVEELSYEQLMAFSEESPSFSYHYGDDFAEDGDELAKRWLERAALELFLLKNSLKNSQKSASILEQSVKDHFKTLVKNYEIQKDYTFYYEKFLDAFMSSYDPASHYFSSYELLLQSQQLQQIQSDMHFYSLAEDQVMLYRHPMEPYWRVLASMVENNPYLYQEEVLLPGDILLGVGAGKRDTIFDLSFNQNITYLAFLLRSIDVKKKKKIFVLRPGEDGTFQPRIVTMTMPTFNTSHRDGVFEYLAQIPQSSSSLDIHMVKFPVLPLANSDYKEIINTATGFGEDDFSSMGGVFEHVLKKRPDVLLFDFRSFDITNPTLHGYDAATEFLSYVMPPDIFLGYVRAKKQNGEGEEEESQEQESEDEFGVFSQRPEGLSEEDHEFLFNTPLVILASPFTTGYEGWIVDVLRSYHRALLVGGQLIGKETTSMMLPGKIYEGALLGASNVVNTRLYGPQGSSRAFTQNPLISDVMIPFPIASPFPGDLIYDQDEIDILSFDPDVFEGPSREADNIPGPEILDNLRERSSNRVERHGLLKKIREHTKTLSAKLLMRPSSLSLDSKKIEHVRFSRIWDVREDFSDSSTAAARIGERLLKHDAILLEALQITADYGAFFSEGSVPGGGQDWELQVAPSLIKKIKEIEKNKNDLKKKKKPSGNRPSWAKEFD